MSTQPETTCLQRLRISYAKLGALRYTGHLDLQRVWERALRRAGLPLAYSQGFNPQPRLHMALALPLGISSECELLDVWLEESADLQHVAAALNAVLPSGLRVHTLQNVSLREPALQNVVSACEYRADLLETPPGYDLESAVSGLLAAENLPRRWRDKDYDLRPLVEDLRILAGPQPGVVASLWMRLAARAGATGRPEETLAALGLDPLAARLHRQRLILAGEG